MQSENNKTIEDLRRERSWLTERLAQARENLNWVVGIGRDDPAGCKAAIERIEAELAAVNAQIPAEEIEEDRELRERKEKFLREYAERVAALARAPNPQPQITRESGREPMPSYIRGDWDW